MTYLDEKDKKYAWNLFGRERGEIRMEQCMNRDPFGREREMETCDCGPHMMSLC
jgi:hypothetical protein